MKHLAKGGKKKNWPRSWRQAAAVGGTLTLKGRGFEKELVITQARVMAANPEELSAKMDEAIAVAVSAQRPS